MNVLSVTLAVGSDPVTFMDGFPGDQPWSAEEDRLSPRAIITVALGKDVMLTDAQEEYLRTSPDVRRYEKPQEWQEPVMPRWMERQARRNDADPGAVARAFGYTDGQL